MKGQRDAAVRIWTESRREKGKGEVRDKLNFNGLGLSVQVLLFPATSLV